MFMSQWKVLVVALCVALTASFAVAQQQGTQGSQQGSQQQSSMQQGSGGSSTDIQQLGQLVNKQKPDLDKAIDKAKQEAKGGQVIGVAVTQQMPGSQAQGGDDLVTHVYVVDQNQVRDFVVDAKGNKVQDSQTRQTLSNPWQQQGGGMQQMGTGTLSSSQAQQIGQLVQQNNVDLKKVLSQAKGEVKGGQVLGAFLVLQNHIPQAALQPQQQSGGQKGQVFAQVYAIDQGDQLRVLTMDTQNNKVLHSDTKQNLSSPWQSRGGSGMGSTGGSQQQGQTGSSMSGQQSSQVQTGSSSDMQQQRQAGGMQSALTQGQGGDTIQGQVVKTENLEVNNQEYRVVNIRTKQGNVLSVNAGLEDNQPDGFEVREGQWVAVSGNYGTLGNRQVLNAQQWANVFNLTARGGVPAGQQERDTGGWFYGRDRGQQRGDQDENYRAHYRDYPGQVGGQSGGQSGGGSYGGQSGSGSTGGQSGSD